MRKTINTWSFFLSLICLALFLLVSFSRIFDLLALLGTHPLNIVLGLTIFTFIIGLFGISGIRNLKTMIRSAVTIVITLGLSCVMSFVIFIGGSLS